MKDVTLLVIFLIAIAIGWLLGRFDSKRKKTHATPLSEEYYRGLNFLLDKQPDEAIDAFLKALDVNSDTIDTHFALGRLFRSRGEVDKATRVHQNLLARPTLERHYSELAQFELATDFMSAGLLDRAERLLKELIQNAAEFKSKSQHLLLEIYQREREWENAIDVASGLVSRKGRDVKPILAHYCCELASEYFNEGDAKSARKELRRALSYDPQSARASLLQGKIEFRSDDYEGAIKALRRIKEQNVEYLSEAVPLLFKSFQKVAQVDKFERLMIQCLEQDPPVTLVLAIAELLDRELVQQSKLRDLVEAKLVSRPSLKGVQLLVDLKSGSGKDSTWEQIRELLTKLVDSKDKYRCSHCGYSGNRLHWLCPGCHQWGKVKPVMGEEDENLY